MKRLYYFKANGQVYFQTRTNHIGVRPLTIEQELQMYRTLQEVNQEDIDVIEIGVDDYAQDFSECSGYRVNPQTKELEFSYPDPNDPQQEPIYIKPLSQHVNELEQENKLLKAQNKALVDKTDFHEELIVELAMEVYK